jgi:nucleoside diphosphate kinase
VYKNLKSQIVKHAKLKKMLVGKIVSRYLRSGLSELSGLAMVVPLAEIPPIP